MKRFPTSTGSVGCLGCFLGVLPGVFRGVFRGVFLVLVASAIEEATERFKSYRALAHYGHKLQLTRVRLVSCVKAESAGIVFLVITATARSKTNFFVAVIV